MRSPILRFTLGAGSLLVLLSIQVFNPTQKVQAVGGGCVIGDDKGDTWVLLWQETPQGGKGKQIWNMPGIKFAKGQELTINDDSVGPNLRMRYDYKNAPADAFHGNVGFTCRNHEKIILQ